MYNYMSAPSMPRIGEFGRFKMKLIEKLYGGELRVRFDEGEQDFVLWRILNGHEAGSGGYSQKST
jgi:hypothetical protein